MLTGATSVVRFLAATLVFIATALHVAAGGYSAFTRRGIRCRGGERHNTGEGQGEDFELLHRGPPETKGANSYMR
jgi:hypothetical protein